MSKAVLKNENNRIVQIQKNGEIVWNDEDYVQRRKIGEPTAQMLRDAETIQDIKQYLARVHKIDLSSGDSE
jgi:hypothetical protein